MKNDQFYLDQILGRPVVARDNRAVGRLEELLAEQRGDYFYVVEFVIGTAGLMARLNMGFKALFGVSGGGKIARWDQIDISDPKHPRLTCSIDELGELRA